ncbi:MAG: helix-hairpin-helix domain-containing protein [Solirubrobacterales bacterium]|nr:helix-hairpin-helix domain-containing protein [Solirubrobacterales bacterium]
MIKYRRVVSRILPLILAALLLPALASAATPTGAGGVTSTGTTSSTVPSTETTDPATTAPITLDPDEVQAMQDAADDQNGSRSVFEKAADFVTDNAPFFIIGIIVLAAIIAGILIVKGRSGSRPSTGPSSAERRRSKRAETQRARQEERLRRQARRSGGRNPALGPPAAAYADPARAAIEAEKAGADQDRVAGAVARSQGAIAAPYSPSQTAPAPGVLTAPPVAGGVPAAPVEAPTASLPLPEPPLYEPSLEAPGADATVGRNAAAFVAATGAGAIAGRAASRSAEGGYHEDLPGEFPPASRDVAGSPAPVVDDRLRATLDDLRGPRRGGHADPDAERMRTGYEGGPAARPEESELSVGLAAVERRLSAEREERDRTLRDAEDRLRRVEQKAEDAERRAAFAERLTQLKLEESEREQRLRDVVSGIERAEQRAEDAESRARAAEISAAAALDRPDSREPARSRVVTEMPRPDESVSVPEPAEPARREDRPTSPPVPEPVDVDRGSRTDAGTVNLNQATFEELRELGLSVTQATRILAYRERFGGYGSLDDLGKVPGFSPEKIESMRSRFSV